MNNSNSLENANQLNSKVVSILSQTKYATPIHPLECNEINRKSTNQEKYRNISSSCIYTPPQQISLQQSNSIQLYGFVSSNVNNFISNDEIQLETEVGNKLMDIIIEDVSEADNEYLNPLISNYLNDKLYIQSNPDIDYEVLFLFIYWE